MSVGETFLEIVNKNCLTLPEFDSKASYLYYLYNNLGFTNLEICYSELKDKEMIFSKWLKFIDLLEKEPTAWLKGTFNEEKQRPYERDEFINKCSHRRIMDVEIMFDIDEKTFFESIEHKSKYVFEKLKRIGFKPHVSWTQNKSFHISIIIPELRNHGKMFRRLLKQDILREFGADMQKSSERCMISIMGSKHYKSGKPKVKKEW